MLFLLPYHQMSLTFSKVFVIQFLLFTLHRPQQPNYETKPIIMHTSSSILSLEL
jgi:hypothetical protein